MPPIRAFLKPVTLVGPLGRPHEKFEMLGFGNCELTFIYEGRRISYLLALDLGMTGR